MSVPIDSPPREDVFRAAVIEFREATEVAPGADDTSEKGRTLSGHFAVFNTPTEIHSHWEGDFIERIAPGAFSKTFRESRDQIRVLLQHGYDPQVGDKPIATITDLREDETGAYYEAELLDGVPDLVIAGLRAGQYGASFRFKVMREEKVDDPGVSEDNPQGLPERLIKEVQVREFGPVTWGQYPEATSEMAAARDSMRSLTDEWVIERLTRDPDRLRVMVEQRTKRMAAEARAMTELQAALDAAAPSAPVDTEGTEPDADTRRDEEQEPDAPVEGDDTPDATRKVKDYLASDPPAWFIP